MIIIMSKKTMDEHQEGGSDLGWEEHRMSIKNSSNSLQIMPSVTCTSVYKQLDMDAPDMRTKLLAGNPSKLTEVYFLPRPVVSH